MNPRKILSILIIVGSCVFLLTQPFGPGMVYDDHYRIAPMEEIIFYITLFIGIAIFPQNNSESQDSSGTETN